MKQLVKAALCFLPLLLLVVAVNWYADPGNAIRSDYEKKVAVIMARGENAANIGNMDDRALMRAYLPMRTQPIDTLVLGSSHSMQITPRLTGDVNTFCAGMTGADLRDVISVYALVRQNGFVPKRVILVADSWFISEGVQEKRAMTEGYLAFCKQRGFEPVQTDTSALVRQQIEKKMQIFSIPYFQSSLNFLQSGGHRLREPVATTQPYAESSMRRADGTYVYDAEYRNLDNGYADQNVSDMKRVMPEFARNFDGISQRLVEQLRAFLQQLRADGCEVVMMLAPFHPDFYEYMVQPDSGYQGVLETEQAFVQIAQQEGVRLFGSYSPEACGLTAKDFYDGLHCTEQAMQQFYPSDLFHSV